MSRFPWITVAPFFWLVVIGLMAAFGLWQLWKRGWLHALLVWLLEMLLRAARGLVKRIESALHSLGRPSSSTAAAELPAEGGLLGMSALVVDDDPVFAEKISTLLNRRGVKVAGVAHNGQEAQQMALALNPQMLLMDIEMPEKNGIEATRAIKLARPHIKIVMLTGMEQDAYVFEALRSGASGYLLKGAPFRVFFAQLEALARGEVPLSAGLAERVLAELSRPPAAAQSEPHPGDDLTGRQWDILERVARGQTYKEIGADLSLTEKTIKYHMGQIIDRLHVANRAQAIRYLNSVKRSD
jgi:two-component system NarL family response regulator